jgi:pimeloyl-ACP methyl ester carboxylesterase
MCFKNIRIHETPLPISRMKTIHCISGLGADHRIFGRLAIPGAQLKHVPWPSFDKHDEMACYAQKIGAQIPKGEDDIILGLSFGGMLASEIARARPSAKVIIVSSAKSPSELPPVKPWVKYLVHNGLIPVGLAKYSGDNITDRFGADTEEEKKMVLSILSATDNHFARCALRAMVEWRSTAIPDIVHIHGTADAMILPDFIHPTHWVEGGKHIMVWSRAEEVSRLIAQHI